MRQIYRPLDPDLSPQCVQAAIPWQREAFGVGQFPYRAHARRAIKMDMELDLEGFGII